MKQTRLFSGLLAMLMTCFVSNAFGATDALEFDNIQEFAELLKVEDNTPAKLTLTNATVQFVYGTSVYVTEGSGNEVYGCLLKDIKGSAKATEIKAGDKLNGTIENTVKKTSGMPIFECNGIDLTNLKVESGSTTPTPKETTIAGFGVLYQYVKVPVSVKTLFNEEKEVEATFFIAPDGYGFAKLYENKPLNLLSTDCFTNGAQGMLEGVLIIDKGTKKVNKETIADPDGDEYYFIPTPKNINENVPAFTKFTDKEKNKYVPETVTEDGTDYVYLNENVDYTPTNTGKVNVKLCRYFQPYGAWATLILPFDMTPTQLENVFGEGMILAEIDEESDKSTLIFNRITNGLKAHVPYIAKVTKYGDATDEYNNMYYYINEVEITEQKGDLKKTGGEWTMTGTYSTKLCGTLDKVSGSEDYFISQNKFNTPGDNTPPMNGFRAYLTRPKSNTSNTSSKEVPFIVEDETTGISELMTRDMISDTFDVYNVNGQLVRANATSLNGLHKGLYIVNGKKYVVK